MATTTSTTVQKFNRNMIEQCLKEIDVNYLKDRDGDFVINYQYDEEIGCGFRVLLEAVGSNSEIYLIYIISDKPISKSNWGRSIMICNEWNKEKLFPKAYLHMDNPDVDSTSSIILQEAIDLEKGIHQELLTYLTAQTIRLAYQFFKWAHKEKGLYA